MRMIVEVLYMLAGARAATSAAVPAATGNVFSSGSFWPGGLGTSIFFMISRAWAVLSAGPVTRMVLVRSSAEM